MSNYYTKILTFLIICGISLPQAFGQAYQVYLDGDQEVPAVKTVASGAMTITLNGTQLTVAGDFKNLGSPAIEVGNTGSSVHLHDGLAGENGGVVESLNPVLNDDSTGATFSQVINLTVTEATNIQGLLDEHSLYVNVHSTNHPSGEIRGQLLPATAGMQLAASLNGDNEVPSVNTGATGGVVATLTGNDLVVSGHFQNLESDFDPSVAGGAHLHVGGRDRNGQIAFNLTTTTDLNLRGGSFEADNNTFTLTNDQVDSLQNSKIYVNVHTTNNPGGEIRGNLNDQTFTVYEAKLSAMNEVPAQVSTGSGMAIFRVNGDQMLIRGQFNDLMADVATNIAGGAHIHSGMAGENGQVLIPLNIDFPTDMRNGLFAEDSNEYFIDTNTVNTMNNAGVYLNIHSEALTSGELRGQITPEADAYYVALLSGMNEVDPVISNGRGVVYFERTGNDITLSGTFSNLDHDYDASIAGGAHLHAGLAGSNGPVEVPINADVSQDLRSGTFVRNNNTFTLSANQAELMDDREIYVNIHTADYPGGEIRGQVVPVSQGQFQAFISGSQEAQPVMSSGNGAAILEFWNDSIVVSGSFSGLDTSVDVSIAGGAHIHSAMAGANGPVEFPLSLELENEDKDGMFAADSNLFQVDQNQKMALMNRGMYFNIHTLDHDGGEIRGQIVPQSRIIMYTNLSGGYEAPAVASRGYGSLVFEVRGGNVMASGTFSELSSDLNTGIAGGAHIHDALAGNNSGVVFALDAEAGSNNREGMFNADSNMFSLTQAQLDLMIERNLYVNIHSNDIPSGELRGQIHGPANNVFISNLAGSNEVPSVNSEGSGAIIGEVLGNTLRLSGSFDDLESDFDESVAGGAHLHLGLAGENGGIEIAIRTELDSDMRGGQVMIDSNEFVLTAPQMEALKGRMIYANLHTQENQGGELRGQMLPYANSYFTTSLMPIHEVPAAMSDGMGGLSAELYDGQLIVTGAFSGLVSNFDPSVAGGAHLHSAEAGENGSIERPINPEMAQDNRSGKLMADGNTIDMNNNQVTALFEGGIYANIHTEDYQGGEIRGQMLTAQNLSPDASMIMEPANEAEVSIEGLGSQLFTARWSEVDDADGDKVVYIWQLATDSAFNSVVAMASTNTDTFVSFDYGTVDSLLDVNGLEVGDSITLYHRALSSDGSEVTASMLTAVELSRDGLVGTEEENGLIESDLVVYPNPAERSANFKIESGMNADLQLYIYNTSGQAVISKDLGSINANGSRNVSINTSQLKSGVYQYIIIQNSDEKVNRLSGKLQVR